MTKEPHVRCRLQDFIHLAYEFPHRVKRFRSVSVTDKAPRAYWDGKCRWVFNHSPLSRLGADEIPYTLHTFFDAPKPLGEISRVPPDVAIRGLERALLRFAKQQAYNAFRVRSVPNMLRTIR